MKKHTKILSGLFLAALAFSSVGVFAAVSNKAAIEANAATSEQYIPNKSTYYNLATITGKTGKELLGGLHDLITDTHKTQMTYDDFGKNELQKKMDQYYDSDNQPVSGKIFEFTSGAEWPGNWVPTSGSASGGYNRGHIWPGADSGDVWSSGSGNKEKGAGADGHHIRPQEMRLNSSMGSSKFGEVSNISSAKQKYAALGSNATYALAGYMDGSVFEPIDSRKGDTARILMYIYAHYNSYEVTSVFGSYAKTNGTMNTAYFAHSKLSITNVFGGTESNAWQTLLEWNTNDPVSYEEQQRNDQVQRYQGNRNPFIDHPEYADAIWGDGPVKTVTSISVSPSSKTLVNDATQQLTVTAHYSDSTTGDVTNSATYTSTNTSVATVSSSGLVTAVASSGSATINISYSGKSTSCSITASAPTTVNLTGVTASNVNVKVGQTATIVPSPQPSNAYPIPTYTYSSNDTGVATVSPSGVVTGVSAGSATITVTATQNSITKTTTCSATVSDAPSSASIVPTDLAGSYPTPEAEYTTASGLKIAALNTANFNSKIQFKKNGGYLLNTESLSLKKLTIVGQSGTLTVCGGSAKGPTTTKTGSSGVYDLTGCSYFKIINSSGNAVTCSSIEIEFGSSPAPTPTVSLNKNSTTLTIGGTETLVATTTGTGTLSWSSNNTGVASVNTSGKITAISAGTATITASYGGATATCTVVVTTSGGGGETIKYTKVTSGTVSSGNYLIVYEGGNVAFNGALTTLDATSNTIGVTINNNEITATTETRAAEFTYNLNEATIKSASGYYIGRTSNKNGIDSSASDKYTNTISVDKGNAAITSSAGPVLKYNNASDQNRFRYYGSGQQSVQLYKAIKQESSYNAESFASDLLTKTNDICNSSKQSGWSDVSSQLAPVWAELKGSNCYGKLDSTEISKLASAVASETGTLIEQAMSKYDHIVARYGFESFIAGRTVSSVSPKLFTVDSSSSISIIVIIALVSATAIGGYLILKRRKEQ